MEGIPGSKVILNATSRYFERMLAVPSIVVGQRSVSSHHNDNHNCNTHDNSVNHFTSSASTKTANAIKRRIENVCWMNQDDPSLISKGRPYEGS